MDIIDAGCDVGEFLEVSIDVSVAYITCLREFIGMVWREDTKIIDNIF